MIDTLQWSSHIYSRLLVLYPEDLRREYGTEMALVFADDLEAARRESGVRGVLRVWRCALSEFLRYALPRHLSSPVVRVPAIGLAVTFSGLCAEMMIARHHAPGAPEFFYRVGIALTLPILSSPAVSLLALWACRNSDTISLDLSDPRREEQVPCSKYEI